MVYLQTQSVSLMDEDNATIWRGPMAQCIKPAFKRNLMG